MIYEFKSQATGSIIATQEVAERILRIIGKTPAAKGVILPEQMARAISELQRAIDAEKRAGTQAKRENPAARGEHAPGNPQRSDDDRDDEPDRDAATRVSLAQRAFPFVDMFRQALAAKKEITWGV